MNHLINELRAARTAALHLGDTAEDEYAWGYAAGVQAAIDLIDSKSTTRSEAKMVGEIREAVERINNRAASDFFRKFEASLAHGH